MEPVGIGEIYGRARMVLYLGYTRALLCELARHNNEVRTWNCQFATNTIRDLDYSFC